MKTRTKILIWVAVLAVGYATAAIAAWRIMPAKIAEAERKRVGVTMALAKIANDQQTASRRISDITKRTLGNGRDKAAQVAMLLEDPTLNRLALTYTGADWATAYSGFAGNAKHLRNLMTMQRKERKDYVSKLNKKIEDLEHQKRTLSNRLKSPSNKNDLRAQMNDIDRQLASCRSSSTYRDYIEKDKASNGEAGAKAKIEADIFKLANDCEAQTVGKLMQAMAEKAEALHREEVEPERMRQRLSYFDIWPFNLLAAKPQ